MPKRYPIPEYRKRGSRKLEYLIIWSEPLAMDDHKKYIKIDQYAVWNQNDTPEMIEIIPGVSGDCVFRLALGLGYPDIISPILDVEQL